MRTILSFPAFSFNKPIILRIVKLQNVFAVHLGCALMRVHSSDIGRIMRCIVLLSKRQLLLKILLKSCTNQICDIIRNQCATKLRKVNNASNVQMFNRQIHNLISLEKYFINVHYLILSNRTNQGFKFLMFEKFN